MTEMAIQQLLLDAGAGDSIRISCRSIRAASRSRPTGRTLRSPETYLGYGQASGFASPDRLWADEPHDYPAPRRLSLNEWAPTGTWTITDRAAVLAEPGGRIAFRFQARDVNLVMGPLERGTAIPFRVGLDGRPAAAATGSDIDATGTGRSTSNARTSSSAERNRSTSVPSRSSSWMPASRRTASRSGERRHEGEPSAGARAPIRARQKKGRVHMKIVVIGGTGLIGSKVVAGLTEHGREAVAASPRLGINTITGEGLAAALDGASAVVDVSNSANFEYLTALEFFSTSTHHLLVAEAAAGWAHHVALSVVGTRELSEGGDLTKTTAGYFLAKLVEEALIRTSGSRTRSSTRPSSSSSSRASPTWPRRNTVRLPPVPSSRWRPLTSPRLSAGSRSGRRPTTSSRSAGRKRSRSTRLSGVSRSNERHAEGRRRPLRDLLRHRCRRTVARPEDGALVGEIRLEDWLRQSAAAPVTAV